MRTISSVVVGAVMLALVGCKDDEFVYNSSRMPYDDYSVSVYVSEGGKSVVGESFLQKFSVSSEESRAKCAVEIEDDHFVVVPDAPDVKHLVVSESDSVVIQRGSATTDFTIEGQRYKIVVDFVRSAPKGMYVDSKLNIVALKCDGVTLECDDKQPSIHFIKENGVYKMED